MRELFDMLKSGSETEHQQFGISKHKLQSSTASSQII